MGFKIEKFEQQMAKLKLWKISHQKIKL